MLTLTQIEDTRATRELLTAVAINRLDRNTDKELLELIAEQTADDTGRAKGEFLGGNGQTQWGHCKGNDKSDRFTNTDEDDNLTSFEREILAYGVTEHQTGIESNGVYNIRDLAHWTRNVLDGDKLRERAARKHIQSLGLPYSKERRDRTREGLDARKARKRARLNARRGIK